MTLCASIGVAAARACVRLPAARPGQTLPEQEKLFSRWATFSDCQTGHDFTEPRPNRKLTPKREVVAYPCRPSLEKGSASCDCSSHRIARHSPRLGYLPPCLPTHIYGGRARPPSIHRRGPEQARRTEPPTSDHPFANGISWRKEMTTCTAVGAAAGAPCLPAAVPETLPKHLTSRCLTFFDPAQRTKATGKSPVHGPRPAPRRGLPSAQGKSSKWPGNPRPTQGEQGRLAQRSFCAHFRRHRSRHQQLPAPGGAGVGRGLRSHRRLFPAGPAGRGSGAERVAVRRGDRAHLACAGRLRGQDRAPPREPRPPHRHRGLPPRLQRRGLPRPW